MQLKRLCAAAAIAASAASSPAQATLVTLDSQQVLDTATNLVWLRDWGQGGGDWLSALNWAGALDVADHDNWFLPSIEQFQSVWASAGGSLVGLSSYFDNVDPWSAIGSPGYWSSTLAASGGGGPRAEIFFPEFGTHGSDYTFWVHSATAARVISEPTTLPLGILALAAGLAVRRRRRTYATGADE